MATEETSTGTASQDGTQTSEKANAGGGKTFTQAELDKAIADRLGREKSRHAKEAEEREAQAIARFREEQGLDDAALEEWSKRDKSAAEMRATKAESTKAKNELAKVTERMRSMHAKLDEVLRMNAIISAATGKSVDPATVATLVSHRVKMSDDFSLVVVDEKGEATSETVDELVTNLLDKKPFLVLPSGRFNGSGSKTGEPLMRSESKGDASTRESRIAGLQKLGIG